jgi:hypothetical protein
MLTLQECYENLKYDLDRMPRHLIGTGWHIDRALAFVRISAKLGMIPLPVASE